MVRAAESLHHPGGEGALPAAGFTLNEEVAAVGEVRQKLLELRSQETAVDVIPGLLPQPRERLYPERLPAMRDGEETGTQATGRTDPLRTPASNGVGGYRGRGGLTRMISEGLTVRRLCSLASERSAPKPSSCTRAKSKAAWTDRP